jgi:hypothetical protein
MDATHTLTRFAFLGLLVAALILVAALPALADGTVPFPDPAPWSGSECAADETGGRSGELECTGTLDPIPAPWPLEW